MKKTTQKTIRNLIDAGAAVDITTASNEALAEIRKTEGRLEVIAVSHGIHGRNGMLIRGEYSGHLYAIKARTQNVFYI